MQDGETLNAPKNLALGLEGNRQDTPEPWIHTNLYTYCHKSGNNLATNSFLMTAYWAESFFSSLR